MTAFSARLRALVVERACESCEYCLVHADYATFAHEVDHIIAKKHGGTTETENLAYACAQCNRFKGSDIAGVDPESGKMVPLFNPRTQLWGDHFRLDGAIIEPISAIGRVTEHVLQLNQLDRVLLRQELIATGRYPFQWGVKPQDA